VSTPICLVHYHELGLKGRNRGTFERQLKRNVEDALDTFADTTVARISGRLLVTLPSRQATRDAARVISLVPGVVRVSCGVRTPRELADVNEAALRVLEQSEPYSSFKVAARRANTNYPLDSMELNRLVGEYLCEHAPDKSVKMKNPDVTVHVEIIEGSAYVYAYTQKAVGGLPVGSSGKVVCLLSAGFDSPVAAWRMMRRWATVIGLHFSGRPETTDASEHLVRDIAQALRPAAGLKKLCIVAFGSYQRDIATRVPADLRVLFYRRLMFAVANAVARREGAKALVTGESLGQVASQTLDNIQVVDAVAQFPVLRPLIGSDKQEIIAESQRLGTYATSALNADDCCTLFLPRNPETHARLAVVEPIWESLPIDNWVDEILAKLETIKLPEH
jgi:thiamine biosynthesis protein ThiI